MLENLHNSKLKKRLLNIFFRFPKRSFSIFELRELARGSSPLVSGALREFQKAEVVVAAARGNRRFFRVNPHFRFYDELEDAISDPEMELDDNVKNLIREVPELKLAIMSGIFALQPQLSLDLLLVGENVDRQKLAKVLGDIEKLIGQEVNYTLMDPEEYQYRLMMNDRFVRDVLDYPHMVAVNTLRQMNV